MPSRIEAILHTAASALASGNFAEAEHLCRGVLASDPNHVDSIMLLAEVASRSGFNLEARQLLRSAIKIDPNNVRALISLARILRTVRAQAEAAELCQRAIETDPTNPEAYVLQGVCFIDLWRIPEAIEVLQKAIELAPSNGVAHDRLGYALHLQGREDESIAAYERAVSLIPDMPNSLAMLGKLREKRGELEAANDAFEEANKRASKGGSFYARFGKDIPRLRGFGSGRDGGESAIRLAPNAIQLQLELGDLLQETGRFEEASALLERCRKLNPEDSIATLGVVNSRRMTEEDSSLVDEIRRQLGRTNLTSESRIRFNFALGKVLDDLGQFEEAMLCFREANQIARKIAPPLPQTRRSHSELVDSMIGTFTPDYYVEFAGLGSPSSEPVFIVGMPRSGTTLLQQMVSSHPQIKTVGELTYLSGRAIQLVDPKPPPNAKNVAELAEGYLRRIRSNSDGAPRVADKMPNNFLLAGIIHLVFPNARIINCRRNPIDTCLSIFVTPIIVDFSHDLRDIAFSQLEFERVTAHWRMTLPPDRFTDVDYEDLVSNPEPHLRRIIEFLGLSWDDAVMNYTANDGAVGTASRWQVRQPLHRRSIERWRNYAPWIPELLEAFPDFTSSPGRPHLL